MASNIKVRMYCGVIIGLFLVGGVVSFRDYRSTEILNSLWEKRRLLEMSLQRKDYVCSSDDGPNCVFLQDEDLESYEQLLQDFNYLLNNLSQTSEYDLALSFQSYDQITRRVKGFKPTSKLSADFGIIVINANIQGALFSNDATPKQPFNQYLVEGKASETFVYSISTPFRMKLSIPVHLLSIMYRAHDYVLANQRPVSLKGDIKLFYEKKEVGKIPIKVRFADRLFDWNYERYGFDTFIDEIEFPPHFDFDNVHVVFYAKSVWEILKLDYIAKLINKNYEMISKLEEANNLNNTRFEQIAQGIAEKIVKFNFTGVNFSNLGEKFQPGNIEYARFVRNITFAVGNLTQIYILT